MKFIFFISLFCFGWSYFIGVSPFPWNSSSQDLLWFLGLIVYLGLFYKKEVKLPKVIIPIVLICFIPFIQFLLGQIYYFSIAFFSFCFIFAFLASILYGYNSVRLVEKKATIKYIAYFFTFIGFISSLFAIAQWFQISHPYILKLSHNRPYANLGQPNHLATLLIMSLCSILFLYEHFKYRWVVYFTLLVPEVLALALTQSRTTWVVIILLLMIFFIKKIKFQRKSTNYLVITVICSYIVLFVFNGYIAKYLGLVELIPIEERLNSGFTRIEMWKHMFYAIMQQPWFGYGWFQTTSAQLEGVLLFQNEGNLTSAHNIMMDLMLWVGIPLSLVLILYSLYLIVLIFKNIKNLTELYVFMMVLCILMHAQLEYPLYYSYFLFPLGFFIGLLLIHCNCRELVIEEKVKQIIFLISISFYALIFKQYDQWVSNLGYASGMENTGQKQDHQSLLFSQFVARCEFVSAKVDKNYTKNELDLFEYYVISQPTYYNLFKLAQIFYFNSEETKAHYYFEVSNALYNKSAMFEDLAIIATSQSKNISSLFKKKNNEVSN